MANLLDFVHQSASKCNSTKMLFVRERVKSQHYIVPSSANGKCPASLHVIDAPVLIGWALVGPGDDTGHFPVLGPLDIQALSGKHPVDDRSSLEDPLLACFASERLEADFVSLGRALEREFVEAWPDALHVVQVPKLVGWVLHLAAEHDDGRPGVRLTPGHVQHHSVHLTDDEEWTSSNWMSPANHVCRFSR